MGSPSLVLWPSFCAGLFSRAALPTGTTEVGRRVTLALARGARGPTASLPDMLVSFAALGKGGGAGSSSLFAPLPRPHLGPLSLLEEVLFRES